MRYTKKFYQHYSQKIRILQQAAAKFNTEFSQQVADQLKRDIFSISWGHHMLLIDKFLTGPQTIEEWEAKLGGNIEHE